MKKLSMQEFEGIVKHVMQTLPKEFQPYLQNLEVEVAETPPADFFATLEDVEHEEDLFGLFEPLTLPMGSDAVDRRDMPHRLWIFKLAHENAFPDIGQQKTEIRKTVIHELAHHFEFDESDLEKLEFTLDPFKEGWLDTPGPHEIYTTDGGEMLYHRDFLSPAEATRLFEHLRENVPWKQEGRPGRRFPRLTAWYADPGLTYSYSGVTHTGLPWTPELKAIQQKVEDLAGTKWNSLLLNYYRDGQDSMGFHADDEEELGEFPTIGSLSLGETRRFVLKHVPTGATSELELGNGSLLIMAGTMQDDWQHGIPKTKLQVGPRINLTWRQIRRQ
jgi:alkylated DNA repair dioxygenase AlkB/predicted Zn-dependent protease with MMP-like domain